MCASRSHPNCEHDYAIRFSYHSGDVSYFEVQISLFDEPWYISSNKDSNTYTIFKEKVEDNGQTHFRRPIDKAFIADKCKSYLKLCVPLWNPKFQPYLSLYPTK